MKQAEKNRKSRDLILKHAFAEFAGNGYAGSSLNLICARGEISKGLLYHYYPNKDALYLACVQKLFDEMTAFLSGRIALPALRSRSTSPCACSSFSSIPRTASCFTMC